VPETFLGRVKRAQRISLTTSLPSVGWLSGKCRSLDVSQPYRPPRPVTGVALHFLTLPRHARVSNWGHFFDERGSAFLYSVTPQFVQEFIRPVMASRSLWTLCVLCRCTIQSSIYTRYKEVSCQCRLCLNLFNYTQIVVENVAGTFGEVPKGSAELGFASLQIHFVFRNDYTDDTPARYNVMLHRTQYGPHRISHVRFTVQNRNRREKSVFN
jgi:hypothetical protein